MELLKTALVIAILTTTSAKPMAFRRHHDADIPDHKMHHRFTGDASNSMSSSISLESQSSEELDSSSEEIIYPKVTPPVKISTAMTTGEEGSTIRPEVSTMGTDQAIVVKTTTLPAMPNPSGNATPTCDQCFTVLIPTAAPITDNRGDN